MHRRPRALLLLAAGAVALLVGPAQVSQAATTGPVSAGKHDSCALLPTGVRCWGFGGDGRLGYGNRDNVGDDEVPGAVAPLDLGATATAVSAGSGHTCALLAGGSVRCWGFGGDGRLGYGNEISIGDDEPPAAAGPVDMGASATAVSAGDAHTCALLAGGSVRCWGYGLDGRLGYGNNDYVGDDETPGSRPVVFLGSGRFATAISAGGGHTCALLDDETVRCWGYAGLGQLGYGNDDLIGETETPGSVGPVKLGAKAKAVSAGRFHTCAILEGGGVRCWGLGVNGQLGYANMATIGNAQTPDTVGPVNVGAPVTAISAGGDHTCAILDGGSVRCWGGNDFGQLGYANSNGIGDDEPPASAGPVDLGPNRRAIAIAAGEAHTCALLDDVSVRCWGYAANGRLGYCNETTIGDDELPGSVGPVDLGAGGAGCAVPGPPVINAPPGAAAPADGGGAPVAMPADARSVQAQRWRRLNACLRAAARRPKRERAGARATCLKRHGRTPGAIARVAVSTVSRTKVVLSFAAPGSNGKTEPPARSYLVKQSRRPIRGRRDFQRALTLCRGACRFGPPSVGARIRLTITDLRPRTTYYYAIAARDNVSNRLGPRSPAVRVRTR